MRKRLVAFILSICMIYTSFSVIYAKDNPSDQIKNIIYLIPDGGGYSLYDFANMVKIAGGLPESKYPYKTPTDTEPMTMRSYLVGSMKTAPVSGGVTDSSAAATAMATGHKTVNGYVGIDKNCVPVANLIEAAESKGKATGLVATYEWMHATPASFSAHSTNRSDYENLYKQIENKGIEVVLGAGYGAVSEYATIQNAIDNGYIIVEGRADLKEVQPGDMLWGNISSSSLPYDVSLGKNQATLEEMTKAALTALSSDPDGFFLMVEGSKVDSGGHLNDALVSTSEYLAFDAAFRVAVEFAKDRTDTVVICAPDHDTGAMVMPENPEEAVKSVTEGTNPSTISWGTEGHSDQNVGVWAYVPEGVSLPKGLSTVPGDTQKTREKYIIDNTALALWCAEIMDVDLEKLSKDLFNDVTEYGTYSYEEGKFTFFSSGKYVYKNEDCYYIDGKKTKTNGKVALYINDKFYVPSEMLDEEDMKVDSFEDIVSPDKTDAPKGSIKGNGTKENPYIIDDVGDFIEITEKMKAGETYKGKYFAQENDIDLTTVKGYIGLNEKQTFAGFYDGKGHKIKVDILSNGNNTIFPYVTGTIINLGTEGSIRTSKDYAMGIARSIREGGKMINCWSSATVTGNIACGLSWSNYGIMENCFFYGTLQGKTKHHIASAQGSSCSFKNCYYVGSGSPVNLNSGIKEIKSSDINAAFVKKLNNALPSASETLDIPEDSLALWVLSGKTVYHEAITTTVESVKISPKNPTLEKGKSLQFSAKVTGKNNPSDKVTWEIEGALSEDTKISSDGLLRVDSEEKAKTISVIAKSAMDGSVADTTKVTISKAITEVPSDSYEKYEKISTAKDFFEFTEGLIDGDDYEGIYFIQTADIDMTSYSGYNGVSSQENFAGVYNGNGYTIKIDIDSDDDNCLFPRVSGMIINLGVTGSIRNTSYAGSFCYSLDKDGRLINCWSDAYVEGADLGQIAWSNSGTMANCYFAGETRTLGGAYSITKRISGSNTLNTYFLGTAYTKSKAVNEITKEQLKYNLCNWLNEGIPAAAKLAGLDESELKTWVYKGGIVKFGNPSDSDDIILTIDSREVSIFGELMESDVPPIIRNGRTMLPARLVAEALGAEVSWSELLRRVTISKDDLTLNIYINRNYADRNNEFLQLDSAPFIENGRTYVPVRFIAEELGATVSWNEDTREVTITRR